VLDQSAWPRVRRLLEYLEEFKGCFSARLQPVSLRRYLQGLLGDSPRKSMQAMLTRVTDPGHYQNFQHFITHATWEWSPVWRRLLERCRRAKDVGHRRHQLPETGQTLGGRRAPVLWRARQDRELPGRDDGPALGQRTRLDVGRGPVSAEGVDARPRAASGSTSPPTCGFRKNGAWP
jgi:hypothetical protein